MRSQPGRMTVDAARRIALAAQGFDRPRPPSPNLGHVRRMLDRIAVVQIDSVNVVARAHELPLWARLGAYPRDAIAELTYRRHEWFEYWAHAASYVPVELQPHLRWRMAHAHVEAWGRMKRLHRDRPDYIESVYQEVKDRGPIAASELSDRGPTRGSWWGWADGKSAIEFLFWAGRVCVTGRGPNFERRYDIAERVLPPEIVATPTPAVDDAHRTLLLRAARAHGVGTARDLADYFRIRVADARPRLDELVEDGALVPVTVDGWRDPAYLHADARRPRRIDARALVGPFDSLVWERSRTERLFGMRFVLEVYTPAHKRVHGYYVLPFVWGDHIVARVDLKADRKASVLRVQAVHIEEGFERSDVMPALRAELESFAAWRDLADVVFVR